MRLRLAAFSLAALVLPLLVSPRAAACRGRGRGAAFLVAEIDITNNAVASAYHFNNRNDADLKPTTQVDDHYGELLDRLNVQASYYGGLRLGCRLDTLALLPYAQPSTASPGW